MHEGISTSVEAIGRHALDAAFKVHSILGPGLLESAYEICVAHELKTRGVKHIRQLALAVIYESRKLDGGYRIDLLVGGRRSNRSMP